MRSSTAVLPVAALRRSPLPALVVAVAVTVASATGAQAAPQILAALETREGMPFHCSAGHCATEISTFCLQKDREAPRTGTAYVPAATEHFRLRLTAKDGRVTEIPATNLSYTSGHGFTSVRVNLPQAQMAKWGAVEARLVVTRQASLIPEPQAGDPNPITPAEQDFVLKSLRPLGEEMIDTQPQATTARVVGRLATAITNFRAQPTPENVNRLWNDVIDDMAPVLDKDTDGTALKGAMREVERCSRAGHHHSMAGVKSCLEYRHGDLMRDLNVDYWNNKPGS